ncbi:putative MFS family arabinose efflux permease [Saccharothrix saharensis]|uniref:Putative MFS family arabinose efflux permease n=1 Tax=Saccharothrix saharensis TaxID=571190 RepID=A0A543JBS2_9PSEU|nr:MFS transporter [Saccharothrix saharensis]TQM80287.1 putative MFS family arabinose efflux permease [Saccharothrix saharensis]
MPRVVHLFALGIFAMVTSEFVVAGLMPQMAAGLHVTIPEIGYLITAFAAAMAVGGPLLTVLVLRLRPKAALMALFAVFLAGNVLAATATDYGVMLAARVVTGAAAQAFFGVTLSVTSALVAEHLRGRATATVLNGLMLGTLLGLPLATVVGEHFGWRAAFWGIAALTVVAAAGTFAGVPRLERVEGHGGVRAELRSIARPELWLVLSTSTFVIGATFAAFSYVNPILTGVTGFATTTVPLLLIAYGVATVVGNHVVGRFADRHALPALVVGLGLNAAFLTGFALFADLKLPAVVSLLGIGLVGVTMNPAMVTRVQRAGNAGPLVNTVHGSFITLGIIIGSWLGGLLITDHGLRAPLWLGAGLAVLGLVSLVPDLRRATRRPALRHRV